MLSAEPDAIREMYFLELNAMQHTVNGVICSIIIILVVFLAVVVFVVFVVISLKELT